MKKKIIICICIISSFYICNAQQTYPIKETYDQILEKYYAENSDLDYNNSAKSWWAGWDPILYSYLKMYEATLDKAYLNKFLFHSYNIQTKRSFSTWELTMAMADDISNTNQLEAAVALYTGRLLYPMAEYVYLLNGNTILSNTVIASGIIPSTIGSQSIITYGDYALWLKGRVVESLDYMNDNYWVNDDKCYSKSKLTDCQRDCADNNCTGVPCIFCDCPGDVEINFNASYAVAMFYISYVDYNNHVDYSYKAQAIMNYFKTRVGEYLPNQSYTWYHANTLNCYSSVPGQPGTLPCREDVNHGAVDVMIPLVAYKLYNSQMYTWAEMNKFAHTFTYSIWDRNNLTFHNNVFGTNNEVFYENQNTCNYNVDGTPNFYGMGEVLCWMPFQAFDDENIIYNLLLTQAAKLLHDDLTAYLPPNFNTICTRPAHFLSGTQSLYGLSEVAKAQWEKECVNLTLYNRDVTYDQDFIVKNKIIVAPQQVDNLHQLNDNSFAEPTTTDNTFVIKAGTTVNMVAGESIELLPGFHAEAGSNFHASINPSACTDGQRLAPPGYGSTNSNNTTGTNLTLTRGRKTNPTAQQKEQSEISGEKIKIIDTFNLYPNPTSGKFYAAFTISNNSNITVQLTDLLGQELMTELNNIPLTSGNYIIPFDCSSLTQGLYLCKLIENGRPILTKKIIIR
jgi:hypothetical protein